MGFEYKLQGTATYTSINCALDDTFSVVLGGLLSCTTYTVRPYLTIDAYKVYGDTLILPHYAWVQPALIRHVATEIRYTYSREFLSRWDLL